MGKAHIRAKWPIRPALITDFSGMKRLGVFLLTLDAIPVHRGVPPITAFADTHLDTWVERGAVGRVFPTSKTRCP